MTASEFGLRKLCRNVSTQPLGVTCRSTGAARNGQGTMPGTLGSDMRQLNGLRRAVEYGATFLDTSDSYGCGHAERLIGRFLREHADDELRLSSKVGQVRGSAPHPYAGRHIHHQFEQTLENLYAEHLDLYVLESFDFGPGDRYLGTAIDQMRVLRQLGSIRAIGMRGPHVDHGTSLGEAVARAERFLYLFPLIRPDVVWTPFNALTPTVSLYGEDLFAFTARRGVGLVLADPLAHGLLAGQARLTTPRRPTQRDPPPAGPGFTPRPMEAITSGLRILRDRFGAAPGTPTRLALLSCLQRSANCVVVFDVTSERQVDENFACLGAPLADDELAFVDETYARMRAALHQETEHRPVQQARV